MLITYISSSEANNYFPRDTDYTASQRTQALADSYNIVNSFLAPEIKTPVVNYWNGNSGLIAPSILKVAQAQLYRYILQSSQHGYDDELEASYQSVVSKLKAIQLHELSLPQAQVFDHDLGWHITEINRTVASGQIYIDGPIPDLRYNYLLNITTGGYPTAIRFSVVRDDSATPVQSSVAGDYLNWVTVDSRFYIRFAGLWSSGDTIRIVGVPNKEVNESKTQNTLKQGPILTGYYKI